MSSPRIFFAVVAACAAGCSQSSLPSLAPEAGGAVLTAEVTPAAPAVSPETTLMVEGTPTEAYAWLARQALHCWFGADGPLKATHIFHADAASPTEGGAADIVLQERDVSLRDQRGVRAFRISLRSEGGGVRVGITNLKMGQAIGGLMVRDAETWARGGEGCLARTLSPAPAAPSQAAGKAGINPRR
jgi:hypothetical protein